MRSDSGEEREFLRGISSALERALEKEPDAERQERIREQLRRTLSKIKTLGNKP